MTPLLLLEAPHQILPMTTPSSLKQFPQCYSTSLLPLQERSLPHSDMGKSSHFLCSLTASSEGLGITNLLKDDLEQ